MQIKQNLLARLPLSGEKTRIRLFEASDLTERYIRWLNDPEVVRYSNQRFQQHGLASCEEYLARMKASSNLFLVIESIVDKQAIGTLTVHVSEHHGTADIGILIGDTSFWGQGFGQDAWNTTLCWVLADPQVRKVTAGTSEINFGMIKLMERSGMQCEGIRKQQEIIEGRPCAVRLYARFNDH